jgi:hypothetical protein
MKHLVSWIPCVVVYAGLASQAVAQDERPPEQAFQTVHLTVSQQPDAGKILLSAITDLNGGIHKGGCASCGYHLWKAYGEQPGPYTYMWVASWPDRVTYEKIHASDEYTAAWNRHPELGPVRNGEIYGRYVEVKPGK